jgi:hypothetical protein
MIGCSTPPSSVRFEMPLAIEVRDTLGQGVPGALVRLNEQKVGVSGPQGQLLVLVAGVEGDTAAVSHECPHGYEVSSPRAKVVLRRLASPEGSLALVPQTLILRCGVTARKVVLLVRTKPPMTLAIRALGKEVGRTDQDGVAQVLLEGRHADEIEVSLDTSKSPRMRPSSPTRRIAFSETPQLLVFDQSFDVAARRPGRKRVLPRRL